MPYRLLGAHVNATVGVLPEVIEEWKPPLVVVLDHSDVWHRVKANSPSTVFVGRLVHSDDPDFNDPTLDPILVARRHCDLVLPWAERMGDTYRYWQGVNEPIINSPEAMERYAAFDAERARIMDTEGFRVVVGTFSVGNPRLAYWQQFLPALEAARQYDGALALHEYAWPALDHEDTPWILLRHRKVYDGAPTRDWAGLPAHLKELPLFITECGLDGLIEQQPPRGWRSLYSAAQYLEQLDWYDRQLQQDPYVGGAAIYCCGTGDAQWSTYDIWQEPAQTLAQEAAPIYRFDEEQPPEPLTGWEMDVEYRRGVRILAGTLPEAGIELTLRDPEGTVIQSMTGSKPEHGIGGFEFLAPSIGTYRLAFLDQAFEILACGETTFVKFTRIQLPPEPPTAEEMLDQLLLRLDGIVDQLEQLVG